jgi:dTDP-glucose 4,6-dehydratase
VTHILVTGGAGFIGSNFVNYWLTAHPDDSIVVLDAFTYAGNPDNLDAALASGRVTVVEGDIATPGLAAGLLREHSIASIIHFAAESHVDHSIARPDSFLQTNVIGTHELLKAARLVWLQEGRGNGETRFHHISTDEVYGSLTPATPAAQESSPYAPNSPYAASKAAADHMVRAYHQTYRLPVSTSNCSNNYGPFQFPEKLISLTLVNLLEGKPVTVYGDGGNVRDWLFVEDHCRAIDRILAEGREGETYNVAGCNQWRNLDIVRLVCRLVDQSFSRNPRLSAEYPRSPASAGGVSEELIAFVQDRPGHDRRYALDTTKIERELGFVPQEAFETGLERTVTWYLENPTWWRRILDGSYRRGKEPA